MWATALFARFASWGTIWLPVLLDAAVKGFAVLLLVRGAIFTMRRASAAARHLVWFLGLVSLLILPVMSIMLPGWYVLPRWVRATPEVAQTPPPPAAPATIFTSSPPLDLSTLPKLPAGTHLPPQPDVKLSPTLPLPEISPALPPLPPTPAQPIIAAPPPAPITWQAWTLLAWLTGTLLLLGYVLLGSLSLWWLRLRATRLTAQEWQNLLHQLCTQIRIQRPVELLSSPRRAMPMIWGLWRMSLLLPAEAATWNPEQRRTVLLHELAHAKRWDCLTQLIYQIVCALYWFNPLVWLAWQRMQTEREQACDDLVLSTGTKPSAYAEQLLHLAAEMPALRFSAAAIAMARPSTLEGRLLAILDGKRNRRRVTWGAALLLILLVGSIAVPLSILKAQEEGKENTKVEAASQAAPESTTQPAVPPAGMGRVVDLQGKPIAGAKLTAKQFSFEATSAADGLFPLPTHIMGGSNLSLMVSKEGFCTAKAELHYSFSPMVVSVNHNGIVKLARIGKISGQLLGREGPLAKATILVIYPDVENIRTTEVTVITDAEGRFSRSNLAAGVVTLVYYPKENGPDTERAALKIKLTEGQNRDDVVLDTRKSVAEVHGRVLDLNHKPLANVKVSLFTPAGSAHIDLPGLPTATTDSQGEYRLSALPPGNWEINAAIGILGGDSKLVEVELGNTPAAVPDIVLPVVINKQGRIRHHNPMTAQQTVQDYLDEQQYPDSNSAEVMLVEPQSPASGNSEKLKNLLPQITGFTEWGLGENEYTMGTVPVQLPSGEKTKLNFKLRGKEGNQLIYDVVDDRGQSLFEAPRKETSTTQPATQPAPASAEKQQHVVDHLSEALQQERDKLLAQADQDIRAGILKLANQYPVLNKPDGLDYLKVHANAGEIRITQQNYLLGQTAKAKNDTSAVPVSERYTIAIVLYSPHFPKDQESPQFKISSLYPNLGLIGLRRVSAGDPLLEAALNKLMNTALQPLAELENRVKIENAATQPTTQPTTRPESSIIPDRQTEFMPKADTYYTLVPNTLYQAEASAAGPAELEASRAWALGNEFVYRTSLRNQVELPGQSVYPDPDSYLITFKPNPGFKAITVEVTKDFQQVKLLPVAAEDIPHQGPAPTTAPATAPATIPLMVRLKYPFGSQIEVKEARSLLPVSVGFAAGLDRAYQSSTGTVEIPLPKPGQYRFLLHADNFVTDIAVKRDQAGNIIPNTMSLTHPEFAADPNYRIPQLLNFKVPPEGLLTEVFEYTDSGHVGSLLQITLATRAKDDGAGKNLIDVTITNKNGPSYTLTKNDLQFFNARYHVLPPASQQHAGEVVPGNGELHLTLDWDEYCTKGLWVCNPKEDPMWNAPHSDDQGTYYRLQIGDLQSSAAPLAQPLAPAHWGKSVQGLQVSLDVSGQTFDLAHPIPAVWTIRNTSSEDHEIYWHDFHYSPASIDVTDAEGHTYPNCEDIGRYAIDHRPAPPTKLTLHPGESKQAFLDLSRMIWAAKPKYGKSITVTGVYAPHGNKNMPKEYFTDPKMAGAMMDRITSGELQITFQPAPTTPISETSNTTQPTAPSAVPSTLPAQTTPATATAPSGANIEPKHWGKAVHGLRVSLDTKDQTYDLSQPIPALFTIQNTDKQDRAIFWKDQQRKPVLLEITDSQGTLFTNREDLSWMISGHGDVGDRFHKLILHPGEVKQVTVDLRDFGGLGVMRFLTAHTGNVKFVGVYSPHDMNAIPQQIFAEPQYAGAILDRIASAPLELTINPPQDDNQKSPRRIPAPQPAAK